MAARESEEDAASAARHAPDVGLRLRQRDLEAPATDECLEAAFIKQPPCRVLDLAGRLSTFHVRICSVVWAKRLHRGFTGVSYRWDYNSTQPEGRERASTYRHCSGMSLRSSPITVASS